MRSSLRPALFLVPGLVAACLAACAGPWSSDRITVVPAQVKEPPGPTDASGMGATSTPSPTAPLQRPKPASAPAPAPAH